MITHKSTYRILECPQGFYFDWAIVATEPDGTEWVCEVRPRSPTAWSAWTDRHEEARRALEAWQQAEDVLHLQEPGSESPAAG